ncbi:MAG: flippase-like domain-containing protein [Clostridia bacterium]|nr:flippase-like domain-containing protein [Clostridia bacterium]
MSEEKIPMEQPSEHIQHKSSPKVMGARKKIMWTLVTIVIAALSVWAVTSQAKDFSIDSFGAFLSGVNPVWIIAGLLCMLGHILFEAAALRSICANFGYKPTRTNSFFYSASDLYISAITPSATGGQPAAAYFMMKDGIPGVVSAVTLLLNLTMYTFSTIAIGIVNFILRPDIFLRFDTTAQVLIIVGYIVQFVLACFFLMLLYMDKLLYRICRTGLFILGKLHLVRRVERKQAKLRKTMQEYGECAAMLKGRGGLLVKTFVYNFLQRLSQIAVALFAFLATGLGGGWSNAVDIWAIQGYTIMGATCVPVPGAMGVTDYLLLNGFGEIVGEQNAVNLELLSRTMSFYLCILICGIAFLIKCCLRKPRRIGR